MTTMGPPSTHSHPRLLFEWIPDSYIPPQTLLPNKAPYRLRLLSLLSHLSDSEQESRWKRLGRPSILNDSVSSLSSYEEQENPLGRTEDRQTLSSPMEDVSKAKGILDKESQQKQLSKEPQEPTEEELLKKLESLRQEKKRIFMRISSSTPAMSSSTLPQSKGNKGLLEDDPSVNEHTSLKSTKNDDKDFLNMSKMYKEEEEEEIGEVNGMPEQPTHQKRNSLLASSSNALRIEKGMDSSSIKGKGSGIMSSFNRGSGRQQQMETPSSQHHQYHSSKGKGSSIMSSWNKGQHYSQESSSYSQYRNNSSMSTAQRSRPPSSLLLESSLTHQSSQRNSFSSVVSPKQSLYHSYEKTSPYTKDGGYSSMMTSRPSMSGPDRLPFKSKPMDKGRGNNRDGHPY